MKKLLSLIFLGLVIGFGNLSAQSPVKRDSMKNNKNQTHNDSVMNARNKTHKDSSMNAGHNMHKDSPMNAGHKMHKDSSMASRSNMQKDSMMHAKNKIQRDSMEIYENNMQQESMRDSGFAIKNRDTTPRGNNMRNDTLAKSNYPNTEGNPSRSDNNMKNQKGMMQTPDVSSWPESSKKAVDEITAKYGEPDGVTADELYWLKKGPWKKICISKMESKHNFPIEHTDMMLTTISYNVPEDKMDDLGKFDGSVTFDRTQGTMSARCDKEGNNFLALNLAHDIVLGKKTVDQARKAYGNIIRKKMNGEKPVYMERLNFVAKTNTADPDKNTTGLTKEQVTKAIAKNTKN